MKYFKLNYITNKEFKNIKEEDIMFITHPGRMGDEDGSTFIIKKGNKLIAYRMDHWMYNPDKCEVTYEEALEAFPLWNEALKHGEDDKYIGKYKFYYMGFGNNLCVDNRITEIFDKKLEELNANNIDDYSLKYNVWNYAAYLTAKELNYDLEYTDDET